MLTALEAQCAVHTLLSIELTGFRLDPAWAGLGPPPGGAGGPALGAPRLAGARRVEGGRRSSRRGNDVSRETTAQIQAAWAAQHGSGRGLNMNPPRSI